MPTLERILKKAATCYKSDAAFERELGLTERTIANWKSGKSKSYLKMLPRIAAALGTSAAYLLGETDDPTLAKDHNEPFGVTVSGEITRASVKEEADIAKVIDKISDMNERELRIINSLIDALKNNR